MLSKVVNELGAKLIHPTTDCVYSGLKGHYNENDKYDVSDIYGMSKAIGEPLDCTVIRTSIIGEEVGQGRSLVEWVKSSANTTVTGFTNHYWNGITCLEFAKICDTIIKANNFWKGTRHIHSNTVNKFELVHLISEIYGLNIGVTPKETTVTCDRSLSTNFNLIEYFNIPELKEQIIEMRNFSDKLYL
jgi:dTDP-4-dehydrorhamnose reductase